MSVRSFEVRYEPDLRIPLEDGTILAASAFMPEGPGPFPTLLNCLPYHKDELFGSFVRPANHFFATRGYAALVVDLRGTGGSTGVSLDAFSQAREGVDCAAAVEWAAEQPWCDGNVGMWGMSYGGITSLGAAAHQPPHLKAIAPIVGGVLDMYLDSFAPGGCPQLRINQWATTQLAHHLSPPMHHDLEGRWYEVWRDRLENPREPWILAWQDHQTRDSFWQEKATDPERIQVPTFLLGGWRDIFPESTMRAFERIQAPKKLLMGPWLHEFPGDAQKAPVDHLEEMCRWWDEWLRGESTGVSDEPPVTLYVQGADFWARETMWPPASASEVTFFLGAGGALHEEAPQSEQSVSYVADPTVGLTAGHNNPGGGPADQGPDEEKSLVFTTEPLTRPLLVCGSSEATLHLAIEDGPDANLVVKLSDVAPDGSSTLISTGWLKASHRSSHEQPEQLEHHRVYEFPVSIWATAYEIAEGHSLRLAFSCSDFPHMWPTSQNPTVRLCLGGAQASSVRIPIAPLERAAVDPPTPNRAPGPVWALDGAAGWTVHRKVESDELGIQYASRTVAITPGGQRVETEGDATATVEASHPERARCVCLSRVRLALPSGGEAFIETRAHVTQHGRMISGRVERDGQVVFERRWLR